MGHLRRADLALKCRGRWLADFQSAYTAQWGFLMAASLVVILPIILIFFVLQRYFVEGVTLTGVKG